MCARQGLASITRVNSWSLTQSITQQSQLSTLLIELINKLESNIKSLKDHLLVNSVYDIVTHNAFAQAFKKLKQEIGISTFEKIKQAILYELWVEESNVACFLEIIYLISIQKALKRASNCFSANFISQVEIIEFLSSLLLRTNTQSDSGNFNNTENLKLAVSFCLLEIGSSKQGIFLKGKQIHTLRALYQHLNSTDQTDLLMQRVMGFGKTKIIGVANNYLKANGKWMSMVIVPKSLYHTNLNDMAISSIITFRQKLNTFSFMRQDTISLEKLQDIYFILKRSLEYHQSVLVTAETLHALRLSYYDCLYIINSNAASEVSKHVELIPWYQQILMIFKNHTLPTIDECDWVLSCRRDVNYSIGARNGKFTEWEIKLILAIYRYLADSNSHLSTTIGSGWLQKNLQSFLSKKCYEKLLAEKIVYHLIESCFEPFFHEFIVFNLSNIPRNLMHQANFQDPLRIYLNQKDNGIVTLQEAQQFIENLAKSTVAGVNYASNNPKILGHFEDLAYLIVLARYLLQDLIPHCFEKSGDENYGMSNQERSLSEQVAIPFLANNTPNETAQFSDRFETACKTIQIILYKGLGEKQILPFLEFLRRSYMDLSSNIDINTYLTFLINIAQFLNISPYNDHIRRPSIVKLQNDRTLIERLEREISYFTQELANKNGNDRERTAEIVEIIKWQILRIREEVKSDNFEFWKSPTNILWNYLEYNLGHYQYPTQEIRSHAEHLRQMFFRIQGYSGTVDVPKEERDEETYKVAGLLRNQKISPSMLGNSAIGLTQHESILIWNQTIKETSFEKILKYLLERLPTCSAFIDTGALFKGRFNEDIAKMFLNCFKRLNNTFIQGILFFNTDNQLCCIKLAGNNYYITLIGESNSDIIKEKTGLRCGIELFTYYDQLHTTGTDLLQNNMAIVTFGISTNYGALLQSVMRMRKFIKGEQHCLFLLTEIFVNHLKISLYPPNAIENRIITIEMLIQFAQFNEAIFKCENTYRETLQKLQVAVEQEVYNYLISINTKEPQKLFYAFQHILINNTIYNRFEDFKNVQTFWPTVTILKDAKNRLLKRYQKGMQELLKTRPDLYNALSMQLPQLEERLDKIIITVEKEISLPSLVIAKGQNSSLLPIAYNYQIQFTTPPNVSRELSISNSYSTGVYKATDNFLMKLRDIYEEKMSFTLNLQIAQSIEIEQDIEMKKEAEKEVEEDLILKKNFYKLDSLLIANLEHATSSEIATQLLIIAQPISKLAIANKLPDSFKSENNIFISKNFSHTSSEEPLSPFNLKRSRFILSILLDTHWYLLLITQAEANWVLHNHLRLTKICFRLDTLSEYCLLPINKQITDSLIEWKKKVSILQFISLNYKWLTDESREKIKEVASNKGNASQWPLLETFYNHEEKYLFPSEKKFFKSNEKTKVNFFVKKIN